MCSDPMPSHNLLNRRAFSGHNFMKFIALTASFKTEAHLLGSSSLMPGLLCVLHSVSTGCQDSSAVCARLGL